MKLDADMPRLFLHARSVNLLAKHGIRTVDDLRDAGPDRVWEIRGVGAKTMEECELVLFADMYSWSLERLVYQMFRHFYRIRGKRIIDEVWHG